MTIAYVGLGANLGPREVTLLRAVDLLAEAEGVDVLEVSQLRETDPVGVVDQPPFLNGAVRIDTSLEPRALLETMLGIERALGRVREERWGPRTVDLDYRVRASGRSTSRDLTVPHPRLVERGLRSRRSPSSTRSSRFPASAVSDALAALD